MKSIRRERVYPHPPQRVWLALTEPRIIASWLMPTEDFAPVVGRRFRFRTRPAPGFDGVIHCTVVEADPLQRLVYTWASGRSVDRPTTVAWTLAAESQGTRLTLEHSGFSGFSGFVLRAMLAGGWGKKVDEFFDIVLQRILSARDDVPSVDVSPLTEKRSRPAGAVA